MKCHACGEKPSTWTWDKQGQHPLPACDACVYAHRNSIGIVSKIHPNEFLSARLHGWSGKNQKYNFFTFKKKKLTKKR